MSNRILPEHIDFDGPFPALSRRLRIGVVGGGRVSNMQAMAARMSDQWEVVAGALSSNPEKAKSRALQWRLPESRCYLNYREMAQAESMREDGIDAVMITTPNHVHAEAATAFLNAGIAVLCDKPLTNTVTDAKALIELNEKQNQVFGVCYVMSCFPMVRQARELVASGRIGKVNQVHVEFMQDWMTPPDAVEAEHVKWRMDPDKSGPTSCTGDIGTHAAHLASFVSGLELTHLRAEMHVCGIPKSLEDTVIMMTRYASSIPGTLMSTRQAPGNRGGLRVRVYGSEGGVEWDLENAEKLRFYQFGEPDQVLSRGHGHGVSPAVERLVNTARGFPEGIIEAWANLYTEFAMLVAARRDGVELPSGWVLLPDLLDGMRGVRFIEATVESDGAGGAWTNCQYST